MSTNQSNAYNSNFDGIHVSKGFVRSLQGQVLKLEQIQQSLIQQLEHANRLATEYHATAVMYQKSYDEAMHKMDEMKNAFEIESAKWNSTSNEIMDKYEKEKQLRIAHEEDIVYLERLLAERCVIENNYGENNDDDDNEYENEESPSPVDPQRYHEYGYDYGYGCGDDCGYDGYNIDEYPREPMSPVSVPSPRPSASPSRLQTQGPILLDPETPKSENDDDDDNQNQNQHQQDDEYDDDDNDTEYEFQMRHYYNSQNYYDSQSSRTTDCSGDPICHSDTDSD